MEACVVIIGMLSIVCGCLLYMLGYEQGKNNHG